MSIHTTDHYYVCCTYLSLLYTCTLSTIHILTHYSHTLILLLHNIVHTLCITVDASFIFTYTLTSLCILLLTYLTTFTFTCHRFHLYNTYHQIITRYSPQTCVYAWIGTVGKTLNLGLSQRRQQQDYLECSHFKIREHIKIKTRPKKCASVKNSYATSAAIQTSESTSVKLAKISAQITVNSWFKWWQKLWINTRWKRNYMGPTLWLNILIFKHVTMADKIRGLKYFNDY